MADKERDELLGIIARQTSVIGRMAEELAESSFFFFYLLHNPGSFRPWAE